MNSISFKNFRQFKEFEPLNLKEISVLVGKNNAGKSTLVKALLLIDSFLKSRNVSKFSFSNNFIAETNIINFGRAKNIFEVKNDKIEFYLSKDEFNVKLIIFGNDDDVVARVYEFEIFDTKKHIKYTFNPIANTIVISRKKIVDVSDQKNVELLNSEIDELSDKLNNSNYSKWTKEYLKIVDEINSLKAKRNKLVHNLIDEEEIDEYLYGHISSYSNITNINLVNKLIEKTTHEITKSKDLLGNSNGIQELIDKVTFLKEHKEKLKRQTEWIAHHYQVEYEYSNYTDYLEIVNEMILDAVQKVTNKSLEKQISRLKFDSNLENGIDGEDESDRNLFRFEADLADIKESLSRYKDLYINTYNQYIESGLPKQSTLFYIRDTQNALTQAIHEYFQNRIDKGGRVDRFVTNWITEFEVGNHFSIKLHAGEAYDFLINDSTHISDKGMGSIQALFIIIKIANAIQKLLISNTKTLIILEEPELNLHPRLQSKLADLFFSVYNEYKIEFLVETHSEYLLRRSQVLVVENHLSDLPNQNPFAIHYFQKDSLESHYQLEYNDDGSFNRKFGDGFFDEASNSVLKLIKYKRQKEK